MSSGDAPATHAEAAGESSRSIAPWLYLFAFVSGMSALVYELSWARMLAFTFGRTTLAASAVVGGFMGGMGVGAWLYHRLQRPGVAPLRIYALLEIGIAATTAALTIGFGLLPELFASVSHAVPAGLPMTLFRVGSVFALLLLPAALMGATYPALCSVLIHTKEEVPRHLGRIYGLNTLGAAAGALLAGLVLIEARGLRGAVEIANAMNLAVGVGAWWLARRLRVSETPAPAIPERALPSRLPPLVTAAVLFGSGLATLSYEIVWFRALRYLFGNSTYALTVMLVVFLVGLGFGGMCFGAVVRRGRPDRVLGWSQLAVALLAMAAIGGLVAILGDDALSKQISVFQGEAGERSWQGRLLLEFGIAVGLILPATLVMGLSYPLATGLLLGDLRRVGAQVGLAYFLANLGSISGAILAAVYFLPEFGTIGATRNIALWNVLLGALVLGWLPERPLLRIGPALLVATAVLAGGTLLPERMPFRGAGLESGVLAFEEEGDLATVQVWADARDPRRKVIAVDGTHIGTSRGPRPAIYSKQLLLAHLPMAIDPSIEHTLNIGLGSGSTLETLASYPSVQGLDAVEISASVVRGSLLFEESRVLEDPRVRLDVEDVSHFLLRSDHPYDLIISDGKQNDDFSGNAAMLCRDFYELAKRRLSADGLLIQWIPQSMPHASFETVLRTFLDSFPHVEVFFEFPGAVMLVGSKTEIAGRARMDPTQYASLRIRPDLDQLMIPGLDALLSRWVASGDDLRAVLDAGPISTWDHSFFEFEIYKTSAESWRAARALNLGVLLAAGEHARARGHAPFLPPDAPFAESTRLLRESRLATLRGDRARARELARAARDANPRDPRAKAMLAGAGEAGN